MRTGSPHNALHSSSLFYLFICLGTFSKSACPHATCTMHYSMIQFKEKIQRYNQVNGSRKRSMFAAQERTRKSIRNRREEGGLVENAKRSATVETADM